MGKFLTLTKEIHVVGKGWYNQTMAYTYTLSPYDVANIGDYRDRGQVEDWLSKHAGDFQSIDDFCTDIDEYDSGWATEEGQEVYLDCMYPDW